MKLDRDWREIYCLNDIDVNKIVRLSLDDKIIEQNNRLLKWVYEINENYPDLMYDSLLKKMKTTKFTSDKLVI